VRSSTSRSFFTPRNQNQQNLSSLRSPEPETQDLLTPRNQTQSLLLAPHNPEPETFLPPCQSRTFQTLVVRNWWCRRRHAVTELLQQEKAEAKAEAEKVRPGLTMYTDRSRLEDGAAGYAVVWKNGQTWKGIKTHMGYNQEAYDAECEALARAQEEALRRNSTPERVTIFTDAQAIRRMASEESGPGQQYAIQARKHIARSGQTSPSRSGGARLTRE